MRLLKLIAAISIVMLLVVLSNVGADIELTPLFPGEDKFSSLSMDDFQQRSYNLSSILASSTEYWSAETPLRDVTLKRWVVNGPSDIDWLVTTPKVLGTSSTPFPGWDSEANGVRVCRISGGTALLSKDTILVRISVNAALDKVGEDYVPDLISRISSQLGGNQTEFDLQVSTISKHVKPNKGEAVEILVEADARADFQFDVYRVANRNLPRSLGDKVFSKSVNGVSSHNFLWDGKSSEGVLVSNGDYDVEIKATSLGREKKQTVSVQVNLQPGKAK